jgi:hypothetical protein
MEEEGGEEEEGGSNDNGDNDDNVPSKMFQT